MIRYIFALCIAAAASRAETITEAVAARQPRLMDPAQILAELTAPALVSAKPGGSAKDWNMPRPLSKSAALWSPE